jgi:hypothetical protein
VLVLRHAAAGSRDAQPGFALRVETH